jgi:hypothetical protein
MHFCPWHRTKVSGQLHYPAASSTGIQSVVPLGTRLGGPHNRSRTYREEKYILPLPRIKPRFVGRPASSLGATPTSYHSSSVLWHFKFILLLPFVLGPLAYFPGFYRQLVGLLGRGISPSLGRYLHRKTQAQNKRRQTSMLRVEFELMVPVSERAKTFHTLDRAAIVTGTFQIYKLKRIKSKFNELCAFATHTIKLSSTVTLIKFTHSH